MGWAQAAIKFVVNSWLSLRAPQSRHCERSAAIHGLRFIDDGSPRCARDDESGPWIATACGLAMTGALHMLTGIWRYLPAHELVTTGEKPEIVETVPGWTHDITNVGTVRNTTPTTPPGWM